MDELRPPAEESERLLRFLYLCPVGLADFGPDGEVRMMNAVAAQLLMPIARRGQLDNLFHALADVAPDLRQAVATYSPSSGPVVRGQVLHVAAGAARRHYSLDVIRIDHDTYMAALGDVTEAVDNETVAREALQLTAVQEGRFEVLTSVLHDIGTPSPGSARAPPCSPRRRRGRRSNSSTGSPNSCASNEPRSSPRWARTGPARWSASSTR